MSAFLGPVHFMLYNKIQRQNDLLNEMDKTILQNIIDGNMKYDEK